jgi:hypothetical protein
MYDFEYDPEDYEFGPDEYSEEYEIKVREIILEAINKKIKQTVDSLAVEKEANEDLRNKNQELQRKIHTLETEWKKTLENALKEKEIEVQRKLFMDLAVGDSVYVVDAKCSRTKCEKCNGTGKHEVEILGKKTTAKCPFCSGGNKERYEYFPREDSICGIKFNLWKRPDGWGKNIRADLDKNVTLEFCLAKRDSWNKRDSFYFTLEDCQKACDQMNQDRQEKEKQLEG